MNKLTYLIFTFSSLILSACSSGNSNNNSPNPCNIEYYIATDGNIESGDGSFANPFSSIKQAQIVIQNSPLKGTCPINVTIKAGIYTLNEPLVFTPLDSGTLKAPITYKAESNASVVISGGKVVDNLDCTAGIICTANIESIPNNIYPRQFYINNQHAIRARSNLNESVNIDYIRVSNGYEQIIPQGFSHPELIEAVTTTQWKMMRCPVGSMSGNTLVMTNPCWNNANTYPEPWNFQLLSWLENAPEFLTDENMWFLDPYTKTLMYIKPITAPINNPVLPILEQILVIEGTENNPVKYLNFENLVFAYATWTKPNSNNGYVSDQSGNILLGNNYELAPIGHQESVFKTPGNISTKYAHNITFDSNKFMHLGAVGLDLGTGSQNIMVSNNIFYDISSSAIQVGSVSQTDMRPNASQSTINNTIFNNDISYTGQDYYDTSSIYVGYTKSTTITHNHINHSPWSSIAIGWGWGLFDKGGFPGLPGAVYNQWGTYNTPTITSNNLITSNLFEHFLEKLWDGGAIYTNGAQGSDYENGLKIELNVAKDKNPDAGSNTYYTDGGSKYITLNQNVSLNNSTGTVNFGPCDTGSSFAGLCLLTGLVSYGAQMGGCLPVGYLRYTSNYFENTTEFFGPNLCSNEYLPPYPINLEMINNVPTTSVSQVPTWIINQAGITNQKNYNNITRKK